MAIVSKTNLDVLPSAFDATFTGELQQKTNRDPTATASEANLRAVKQWAELQDGTTRSLQQRLSGAAINVREHGVTGDGATDDTANLTTAFATGVGVFFLPPGTYIVTGDIAATAGSIVLAAGATLSGGSITGTDITVIGFMSSGAGTPISSVTPSFIGQEYFQTTPATWYKASGLTNADWLAIS